MSGSHIIIEMLPAGNGDAFLLTLGKYHILIDCGYVSTYNGKLRQRLMELSSEGKSLDLLIITHVDADHISGAISLLKENTSAAASDVIEIKQIWHNSYRHLNLPEKRSSTFEKDADKPFSIPFQKHIDDADESAEDVSFKQGTTLAACILQGAYDWNTHFKRGAATSQNQEPLVLGQEVVISVLGPTAESLDAITEAWRSQIADWYDGEINEDDFFDDAFERLMDMDEHPYIATPEGDVSSGTDWVISHYPDPILHDEEDTSVTNGSSIVVLIEYAGRKLLFTGDAVPSGLIPKIRERISPGKQRLELDVFKVPHHGSLTNNSADLYNVITSDHYLISTNGIRHKHPHVETLSLIARHDRRRLKQFHFNYRQEKFIVIEGDLMKEKYNYDLQYGNPKGYHRIKLED